MSVEIDKSRLRDSFKKRRSLLSKQEVAIQSSAINKNFIENLLPKIYQKNSNKIFSIYLSSGNEVNTRDIIDHFEENNISFSYPKIIAKNHPLKFILARQNQSFESCKIYPNIIEPIDNNEVVPDILIMPLVAFDRHLNRLGAGGGFFDRTISFLKSQNKKIITVGLAYDFQGSIDALPSQNSDQRLDFIATTNQIFLSSQ